MRRAYVAGTRSTWAMLASSFRGGEAACVHAGRHADDAPEMPVQLALVVKADGLRRLGDPLAAAEQLPGARDPEVGQVLVGRQAHPLSKRAHQVKLVEPGIRGQVVERDLVGERVVKEGARAAHSERRAW